MKKISQVLTKYKHDYYSVYHRGGNWGNTKVAEEYLQKYWLDEGEYRQHWKGLQDSIFTDSNDKFPNIRFNNSFNGLVLGGGVLFEEEDFGMLQRCMQQTNDRYFVIIENEKTNYFDGDCIPLRMIYSAKITWQEIISGNFISTVLFNFPEKEYFVFGDSGFWGKYSANEYRYPLEIIGFKREYQSLFSKQYKSLMITDEKKREIKELIPQHQFGFGKLL